MDKMTLFYMKQSGDIKELTQGVTDYGFFDGEMRTVWEMALDYIIVDFDEDIVANMDKLQVLNGKVVYKEGAIQEKFIRKEGV